MLPRGIAISALSESSDSAYAYRIMELAKRLRENDIQCDLFFAEDHAPLRKQTAASLFMLFWLRMLRKYDFIYCGAPMAGQSLYFVKAFVPGLVVLDMHGDDIAQSALANEVATRGRKRTASPRVKIAYKMAVSAADYWITQSRYQMVDLIASGVDKDHVSVVRNGVDLDLFKFIPFPEKPMHTFAYVGAFQVWQGIDNLISAFERVTDPSVRMLMVGFKPEDAPLKRVLVEKFGERVTLVDMVDRPRLLELLSSAGIMLSARPGHIASRAAFPTKFAEYAAIGRPILVTRVDETAEFVEKYDCGFVSEPNPDALAKAMEKAAHTPKGALAEKGIRARKMAEEHFSWARIGYDYAKLIIQITGCRQ